jgi:hypothetical protein
MHVDVRGIEAVGERARGSCGCGEVAAGSVRVDGYVVLAVGSEAGGVAPWELTAVEEAGCRVQSRYQHQNGANG